MLKLHQFVLYSIQSLGLLALLYKLFRYIRVRRLASTYFHDKTVLITGASQGLGKAIAQELYPLGAQVIICARNNDELMKLKNELMKNKGKEPEILCMDVGSKPNIMHPKLESLYQKFGKIDILINNAGVSYRGESFTAQDETYQKIMDVNFFGPVRLTNYIVNRMIEDNQKKTSARARKNAYAIVNIGSVQSYLGLPYRSIYCSSKHALLAYSDALRAELYAHRNIDVINVQPGYINTNVSLNALTSDGEKNSQNDDDHRNGFDPNEVARRMIYAILRRDKEVLVVILLHRVAIWLRFFFPSIFFRIMYIRAKKTFDKKFQ